MNDLVQILVDLGKKLEFDVNTEVPASPCAWIDVVWFDKRFNFPKPGMETLLRVPKLPLVGFEIEYKTASNVKHVKGSVSNLDNLSASMSIIVLGKGNLDELRKKGAKHKNATPAQLWKHLIEKTRMAIIEANPITRTVVMTETEILEWAKKEGVEVNV